MLRVALRGTATLLLLVLVAPFVWRSATGDTFMTVTSGSMRPTYQVGDVLLVQPARGDELTTVGAVVVASFPGDAAVRYAHRVDGLTDAGAWLRGDANTDRDPQPITQAQVEGTPRFVVGGITAGALTVSQSLVGRAVLAVAALVLLLVPVRTRRPHTRATPGHRPDHRLP